MKINKQKITEFVIINAGVFLVASGVYFFKIPNNFTTGGVTAISILLSSLFPNITAGNFISVLNILFLVLGFIFVSKSFGFKTIYGSFAFSGIIYLLERIIPLDAPITNQKLLELCFSVILPAIGTALLFNIGASTGGTDIAAMILRKYFSINIGNGLLVSDFLIALIAGLIFGIETCLFSMLGLFLKALMVDGVIESMNRKKSMLIVTKYPKEICEYITAELSRGATIWNAHGGYTDSDVNVIMTALGRYQASKLRKYIKNIDENAFIIVSNTSEIYGKGFMIEME